MSFLQMKVRADVTAAASVALLYTERCVPIVAESNNEQGTV